MGHAFAARGSLSTILNTLFGGSDVDGDNRDSCETGGCGESIDCRKSVDCGESGNFESLVIVDRLVVVRLVV